MSKNLIYSKVVGGQLAAGGAAHQWNWNLDNNNRDFIIKSILWDLTFKFNVTLSGNIPLEMVQTVLYYLQIGQPGTNFANSFTRGPLPAGGTQIDGQYMVFWRPKKYNFDSFYVQNTIPFVLEIENYDALRILFYSSTIICEIDDLDIKQ